MEDNTSTNEPQEGAGSVEGQEAGAPDPIKNVKAEFSRKLENETASLRDQLRQQSEILQALHDQIAAGKQQAAPPAEEVDPVLNPEKFRQQLKEEVKREVVGAVEEKNAISQRTQQEIMRIQGMFPEFAQDNSEAAKLVMQKYHQLPQSKRGTPDATKAIMLEAAAELGLTPVSARKRSQEAEDDFTLSGSSSANTGSRRREGQGKVDPRTAAFAELIGLNPNDPNVAKNLAERSKRDAWGKWRS